MAQDGSGDDRTNFLTALTTEHFALQSAASTTVSESAARASLYVMTLSSSLVALGFAADTDAFGPLVSTIIPVIVVLGIFTTVRLVDTGIQNVQFLSAIAHIRSYYRTLAPDAATFFPSESDDEGDDALATVGVKRRPSTAMFTIASMISAVNCVLAGAGVALAVAQSGSRVLGIACGAATTVLGSVLFYRYQSKRYNDWHDRTAAADAERGDRRPQR